MALKHRELNELDGFELLIAKAVEEAAEVDESEVFDESEEIDDSEGLDEDLYSVSECTQRKIEKIR